LQYAVRGFAVRSQSGQRAKLIPWLSLDENPGHETNARFVASASTVIIEDDKEVAEFIRELASAKVLYIRIRSFNAGRTTAEDKVDGASAAIAAAYATCPVKPLPPPQRVATQSPSKRR